MDRPTCAMLIFNVSHLKIWQILGNYEKLVKLSMNWTGSSFLCLYFISGGLATWPCYHGHRGSRNRPKMVWWICGRIPNRDKEARNGIQIHKGFLRSQKGSLHQDSTISYSSLSMTFYIYFLIQKVDDICWCTSYHTQKPTCMKGKGKTFSTHCAHFLAWLYMHCAWHEFSKMKKWTLKSWNWQHVERFKITASRRELAISFFTTCLHENL